MKITRLSELNDYLGFVVLSAPNKFPKVGPFGVDPTENLEIAFSQLRDAMSLVKKKTDEPKLLQEINTLLESSLTAYRAGDNKQGAHLLQDIQNILFPERFGNSTQGGTA
jgi:hypothetical protein